MSNFKVDDEVFLTGAMHKEPKRVAVTRVGRKWAYVEVYGREYAFDKVTGYENCHVGYPDRIQTAEMMVAAERRKNAVAALDRHGIGPKGLGDFTQSTDTLEEIVAILERADV